MIQKYLFSLEVEGKTIYSEIKEIDIEYIRQELILEGRKNISDQSIDDYVYDEHLSYWKDNEIELRSSVRRVG